jgi:predicted HicB family RNase H-like nuclease
MPLKEGYKKMNLNVETDLHNAFKAATAAQGKSITEVLLDYIRDYVKKNSPGGVRKKKARKR